MYRPSKPQAPAARFMQGYAEQGPAELAELEQGFAKRVPLAEFPEQNEGQKGMKAISLDVGDLLVAMHAFTFQGAKHADPECIVSLSSKSNATKRLVTTVPLCQYLPGQQQAIIFSRCRKAKDCSTVMLAKRLEHDEKEMRSAALMRFAQRMQAKGRAAADMSKNRGKTGAAMTGPRAKLFCPRASAAPALLQTQLTPSPASTAAQVSTEAKHKQRAQGSAHTSTLDRQELNKLGSDISEI
ncbi:MAG: hypothetical protein FRX49_11508 [Trebouxia sp. A1-2]|nr:MAG: hypothetical protein FRX49_11508 [Trebouxia sp. A1-2]